MSDIRALIHVHTDYSFDSNVSLDTLARFLAEHDFGCVAVTDHDTIEGGRRLRSLTGARVIIGEEVSTRDGHLIGLFLSERVRAGMSAEDTARAIRDQGGVVLLPHPFAPAFFGGLGDAAWRIADLIDAVEANNAQSFRTGWDRRANDFADRLGLPKYAGSDSHIPSSIAPCYQLMPDFTGPDDFLEALAAAELKVGYHLPAYFAVMAYRDARCVLGLGPGGLIGANAEPDPQPLPEAPGVSLPQV